MLSQEMIELIARHSIGVVATMREDGAAAASPKATFLVLNSETLAFAHIRSPGTVAHLVRDPRVEIVFTDPFHRIGCRVRGRAAYAPRDRVPDALLGRFEEHWPDLFPLVKGAVTIRCEAAAMLASPSYDIGATAGDLAETWLRRFADQLGYDISRKRG